MCVLYSCDKNNELVKLEGILPQQYHKRKGNGMKMKLAYVNAFIIVVLIGVTLSLSDNLHNLKTTVEAMKHEEVEEINESQLEEEMDGIEERVSNLEIEMPDQDLNQFIKSTLLEFNRMEDLLHKMDGLETKFGIINGLRQSRETMETILDVELADTQENIHIIVDENCTVYMIGQFARAPIETEAFMEMMEQDLKNDFQQGFTFKILNGKAVHIYQGWGELN